MFFDWVFVKIFFIIWGTDHIYCVQGTAVKLQPNPWYQPHKYRHWTSANAKFQADHSEFSTDLVLTIWIFSIFTLVNIHDNELCQYSKRNRRVSSTKYFSKSYKERQHIVFILSHQRHIVVLMLGAGSPCRWLVLVMHFPGTCILVSF